MRMRRPLLIVLLAACGTSAPPKAPITATARPATTTNPAPNRAEAAAIIADGRALLDPMRAPFKPSEVATRWEKACGDGMVDVCVALAEAWLAGDLYFAQCPRSFGGLGIDTANPERARVFYDKACKSGHRNACAQLDSLGSGEPTCI